MAVAQLSFGGVAHQQRASASRRSQAWGGPWSRRGGQGAPQACPARCANMQVCGTGACVHKHNMTCHKEPGGSPTGECQRAVCGHVCVLQWGPRTLKGCFRKVVPSESESSSSSFCATTALPAQRTPSDTVQHAHPSACVRVRPVLSQTMRADAARCELHGLCLRHTPTHMLRADHGSMRAPAVDASRPP